MTSVRERCSSAVGFSGKGLGEVKTRMCTIDFRKNQFNKNYKRTVQLWTSSQNTVSVSS